MFLSKSDTNYLTEKSFNQEEIDGDSNNEQKTRSEKVDETVERAKPRKNFIVNSVRESIKSFVNKDVRVVALGDSLTEGIGDETEGGGYIGTLEKMLNEKEQKTTFKNYGKEGMRTDQLVKKLEEQEVRTAIKDANIVLITIGANDIMKIFKENITNLTYDKFARERPFYESRLNTIFNNINEVNPNASIYLLGFYNPFHKYFKDIEELNKIVNEWNESSETVASSFINGTFIPIKDLFQDDSIHLFADDHFHPNKVGYDRIAKRVLDYLIDQNR